MKAKVKIENMEYFVDFNLRPLIINNVDKEVDDKTKNKIKETIQKYILKKYGKYAGDFYVKMKHHLIDYVNKKDEFRMVNILDDLKLEYNTPERETLYRIIYEFRDQGYLETIHKGKYKLLKKIPVLK